MGYRAYLGKIPRTEHLRYAGLTENQVDEHIRKTHPKCSVISPPGYTSLVELGKYVNFGKDANEFYTFEMQEQEFKIMDKQGFKDIITSYISDIRGYYNDIVDSDGEIIDQNEARSALYSKRNQWNEHFDLGILALDLDETGPNGFISTSWLKEYSIFELVYHFKTFDWENDFLIYQAY